MQVLTQRQAGKGKNDRRRSEGLEAAGISVFLCSIPSGQDIADAVTMALRRRPAASALSRSCAPLSTRRSAGQSARTHSVVWLSVCCSLPSSAGRRRHSMSGGYRQRLFICMLNGTRETGGGRERESEKRRRTRSAAPSLSFPLSFFFSLFRLKSSNRSHHLKATLHSS